MMVAVQSVKLAEGLECKWFHSLWVDRLAIPSNPGHSEIFHLGRWVMEQDHQNQFAQDCKQFLFSTSCTF